MIMNHRIWNEEKTERLKQAYPTTGNAELAIELGVSLPSLKQQAHRLGLKKALYDNKYKVTPEIRERILILAKTHSYADVKKELGVSVTTIRRVIEEAVADGYVKKSNEEIRRIMSEKRLKLLEKERRWAIFGFDQKTKLKLWSNKDKWRCRASLKRNGYYVGRNASEVYVYFDTKRNEKLESEANANGISISDIDFEPFAPDEIYPNGDAEKEIAKEEGLL